MKQRGFTLLELMISIAIIGIVTAVSVPKFEDWTVSKSFRNEYNMLIGDLKTARLEAMTRNTTTRISVTGDAGNYTIAIYYAPSAVSDCDAANEPTLISSRTSDLASRFEITGTGMGDLCFYRDRTSTGGIYTISQVDGGTEFGSASIEVFIATGYLDASMD